MADFSNLSEEELVKIESRLFRTYSQLAAIVDSSDDAIIGMNTKNIITSWNKGAEKIYGYTASEMMGQNISRLYAEDKKDEIQKLSEKILKREVVKNYESDQVTKSSNPIICSLTLSPVKGEADSTIGFSMISRDITEQKLTEAKLSKYEEVNRLNRLMVDRELAMIELKKQITELKEKLSECEAKKS